MLTCYMLGNGHGLVGYSPNYGSLAAIFCTRYPAHNTT